MRELVEVQRGTCFGVSAQPRNLVNVFPYGSGHQSGGSRPHCITGARKEEEPAPVHHALKYGAPSGGNLRFFKNFVVCYDARLRNPSWVLEHITRSRPRGIATR